MTHDSWGVVYGLNYGPWLQGWGQHSGAPPGSLTHTAGPALCTLVLEPRPPSPPSKQQVLSFSLVVLVLLVLRHLPRSPAEWDPHFASLAAARAARAALDAASCMRVRPPATVRHAAAPAPVRMLNHSNNRLDLCIAPLPVCCSQGAVAWYKSCRPPPASPVA